MANFREYDFFILMYRRMCILIWTAHSSIMCSLEVNQLERTLFAIAGKHIEINNCSPNILKNNELLVKFSLKSIKRKLIFSSKNLVLKSHFVMGVLLQVCCIFSEHLFIRTQNKWILSKSLRYGNSRCQKCVPDMVDIQWNLKKIKYGWKYPHK